MKRLSAFILLLTIFTGLAGCGTGEPETADTLTEDTRQTLMWDMILSATDLDPDQPGEGAYIFDSQKYFYLGTFQGYDAVYAEGAPLAVWDVNVGQEHFFGPSLSTILLLQGTSAIDFWEAYRDDRIDEDTLFSLAKRLYLLQRARFGPDRLAEAYGDFAERYAAEDPADQTYVQALDDEKRQSLMRGIICYNAKTAHGWDINNPGEGDLIFRYDEERKTGYWYMGTYSGYAVVYTRINANEPWAEQVGEELFSDVQPFAVNLYHNGQSFTLEEALQKELITDADLMALAKRVYHFLLNHTDDPARIKELYGEFAARYE